MHLREVRDEEAVGSDTATPTDKSGPSKPLRRATFAEYSSRWECPTPWMISIRTLDAPKPSTSATSAQVYRFFASGGEQAVNFGSAFCRRLDDAAQERHQRLARLGRAARGRKISDEVR